MRKLLAVPLLALAAVLPVAAPAAAESRSTSSALNKVCNQTAYYSAMFYNLAVQAHNAGNTEAYNYWGRVFAYFWLVQQRYCA